VIGQNFKLKNTIKQNSMKDVECEFKEKWNNIIFLTVNEELEYIYIFGFL
jgi:hypothetical protein